MTAHASRPHKQQTLRTNAEEKLREGNAPLSRSWQTSQDALTLLHKLASSQDSAGDALKLLHELQVHQVELDLQYEQLEASEHELAEDLIHCARLFDFAPVGYFSVSPQGNINRVNAAGAALCGEDQADLIGRRIDDFLAPESRPMLETLMAQVGNNVLNETCEVLTSAGAAYHVKVGLAPGESDILMVFVDPAEIP